MRNLLTTFRAASLWILLLPVGIGFIGAASNQAVLIANNDLFPVRENIARVVEDLSNPKVLKINEFNQEEFPGSPIILDLESHCLMSDKTHLNWLADNFDIGGIYSLGDFLLMLGSWLWTFCPFIWAYVIISEVTRT